MCHIICLEQERVKEYIDETFKRMIEEEQRHLDQLCKQIQKLEEERFSLLKELGRKYSEKDDKYNNSHLTLIEIVKDLTEDVKSLSEEKQKRMVEVGTYSYINKIIQLLR